MKERFRTLKDFSLTVDATQVSLGGGGVLSLEAGLDRAVRRISEVRSDSAKVLLVGNGGSAAIASHQAVDLTRNAGIRALAFNDSAHLTCIANDFGYEEVFSRPIGLFCDPGDLLLAVSSSGKSSNILKSIDAARKKGGSVITFSGFRPSNPLRSTGDINFYVPSTSYGIVEVCHLLLIHAIVDESIRYQKRPLPHDRRVKKKSIFPHAPHKAD